MRTDSRTDSSSSSLFTAREIELDVEREDVDLVSQRREVAHGHDVIEPVDADPLAGETFREPLTGPVREHLILDPARAVLAHVARLRREHDRGLAYTR